MTPYDPRDADPLTVTEEPLSHGFSPRPEWAGTCPRCGAVAGSDCAVFAVDPPRSGFVLVYVFAALVVVGVVVWWWVR